MKRFIFIMLTMFLSFSQPGLADESLNEKTEAGKNGKQVDKSVNRAEEVTCAEGDLECLQRKAEHRVKEVYDSSKDKTSEIREKIDNDRK
ncbi:hypothetical protein [Nitrosomonas sp. Nm166]|uniref:hypothetical protein n=1 Tax=Nitrosomonas sp. Nm166 TaxID=1881054 RepID=UPI0008E564C0|nr:hypothetical protein [Nitrosomonas sp. Nm166]SFE49759.1 hypothetical protein SAMN05428977_101835 [Nitrosomonas sp. Nm166]